MGIVGGEPLLDLPYVEDVAAEVDMNVVMTGEGKLVEVQGMAEKVPADRQQFNRFMDLAALGIEQLVSQQRAMLSDER